MRRAALAALILAGVPAGHAGAQVLPQEELPPEELPGTSLTTTVSQSVEADSNFRLDDPSPGTTYLTETRLALDLLNQTPNQSFALGFDSGLRALWEAEEPFEFTAASPSTASLAYAQEGLDTAFDARFRVRHRQVEDRNLIGDELIDPDDDLDPEADATREGQT